MVPEFIQPARMGAAFTFDSFTFPGDDGASFQVMPINLSPEEIRTMVQEILG